MKPLDEQNHYEVLEVAPTAPASEIERAYRVIQSAYTEDSMALYSLFEERDSASIRARIDLAYGVLSDSALRHDYDASIGIAPERAPDAAANGEQGELLPPPDATSQGKTQAIDTFEDLEAVAEEQGSDLDGPSLRRARMRRGVALDHIAKITKINVRYLRSIEDEKFDQLPAAVYVRGFVSAFARMLGLDGARVGQAYVARLEAAQSKKRRGRLLGRK